MGRALKQIKFSLAEIGSKVLEEKTQMFTDGQ